MDQWDFAGSGREDAAPALAPSPPPAPAADAAPLTRTRKGGRRNTAPTAAAPVDTPAGAGSLPPRARAPAKRRKAARAPSSDEDAASLGRSSGGSLAPAAFSPEQKASADPLAPPGCHVMTGDDGALFWARLVRGSGNDLRFASLQLLRADERARFYTLVRWGRPLRDATPGRILTEHATEGAAVSAFRTAFADRTGGGEWGGGSSGGRAGSDAYRLDEAPPGSGPQSAAYAGFPIAMEAAAAAARAAAPRWEAALGAAGWGSGGGAATGAPSPPPASPSNGAPRRRHAKKPRSRGGSVAGAASSERSAAAAAALVAASDDEGARASSKRLRTKRAAAGDAGAASGAEAVAAAPLPAPTPVAAAHSPAAALPTRASLTTLLSLPLEPPSVTIDAATVALLSSAAAPAALLAPLLRMGWDGGEVAPLPPLGKLPPHTLLSAAQALAGVSRALCDRARAVFAVPAPAEGDDGEGLRVPLPQGAGAAVAEASAAAALEEHVSFYDRALCRPHGATLDSSAALIDAAAVLQGLTHLDAAARLVRTTRTTLQRAPAAAASAAAASAAAWGATASPLDVLLRNTLATLRPAPEAAAAAVLALFASAASPSALSVANDDAEGGSTATPPPPVVEGVWEVSRAAEASAFPFIAAQLGHVRLLWWLPPHALCGAPPALLSLLAHGVSPPGLEGVVAALPETALPRGRGAAFSPCAAPAFAASGGDGGSPVLLALCEVVCGRAQSVEAGSWIPQAPKAGRQSLLCRGRGAGALGLVLESRAWPHAPPGEEGGDGALPTATWGSAAAEGASDVVVVPEPVQVRLRYVVRVRG